MRLLISVSSIVDLKLYMCCVGIVLISVVVWLLSSLSCLVVVCM